MRLPMRGTLRWRALIALRAHGPMVPEELALVLVWDNKRAQNCLVGLYSCGCVRRTNSGAYAITDSCRKKINSEYARRMRLIKAAVSA